MIFEPTAFLFSSFSDSVDFTHDIVVAESFPVSISGRVGVFVPELFVVWEIFEGPEVDGVLEFLKYGMFSFGVHFICR